MPKKLFTFNLDLQQDQEFREYIKGLVADAVVSISREELSGMIKNVLTMGAVEKVMKRADTIADGEIRKQLTKALNDMWKNEGHSTWQVKSMPEKITEIVKSVIVKQHSGEAKKAANEAKAAIQAAILKIDLAEIVREEAQKAMSELIKFGK
jgi:hypothetical protein